MVELMRKCIKMNDYREIDRMITEEIKPFLFNEGNGEPFLVILLFYACKCVEFTALKVMSVIKHTE